MTSGTFAFAATCLSSFLFCSGANTPSIRRHFHTFRLRQAEFVHRVFLAGRPRELTFWQLPPKQELSVKLHKRDSANQADPAGRAAPLFLRRRFPAGSGRTHAKGQLSLRSTTVRYSRKPKAAFPFYKPESPQSWDCPNANRFASAVRRRPPAFRSRRTQGSLAATLITQLWNLPVPIPRTDAHIAGFESPCSPPC